VIPIAVALAGGGLLPSADAWSSAVAASYEVMIRVGLAIDGGRALTRGVWPTLLGAPMASAAVAAHAYGLSPSATAGALSTAAALSTATPISPRAAATSRWLSLELAAANGLASARAARDGVAGNPDLLERARHRLSGVPISKRLLLGPAPAESGLEETGMKPYPIARQALAAVEACHTLARIERLDPADIDHVTIGVPGPQLRIIDQPAWPATRFDSIVSVQYRAARALSEAADPSLASAEPPVDGAVRHLMTKIHLVRAPDLEPHYPEAWPARVQIEAGGRRVTLELLHPKGDARNPLDATDVEAKFRRAAAGALDEEAVERIVSEVAADEAKAAAGLWEIARQAFA
jgi:2-methylcitrate dehydratase PrpD